jgi:hypothetical protein
MNLISFLTISGSSLNNLTDAYHGSRRGLSSTMDMMNQLEVCPKFLRFIFLEVVYLLFIKLHC